MTRRDRVLAAVAHRQPDFCPYQLDFTEDAYERTRDYLGDDTLLRHLGNHMTIMEWGGFDEVKPGFVVDHFGVVWNRTVDRDIGIVEQYKLQQPDCASYQFPDPQQCSIAVDLDQFVADNQDRLRVVGIGFSGFERAWTLRGMENLLMDMYYNQSFVHELMERITEFNLGLIERTLQYDVDCFRFGDDWGQQQGLIFGAKLWRRFLKPGFSRMFARIKQAGKLVMLHSCGKVQELFPDLIDMGLDIFNTFQPEIMDPAEMKRLYGNHLTFYGGISTQQVLPFASPAEVKQVVRNMIDLVGQDGGYIVAPTHAMPRDIPPENIVAFIEEVQRRER